MSTIYRLNHGIIKAHVAFIISSIMIFMPFSHSCLAENHFLQLDSDIEWMMELYGYEISSDTILQAALPSSEYQFDCGDAKIVFSEVVYDGYWIYTSAKIIPSPEDKILIMPIDASMTDYVAGGYKENIRKDTRTFKEAAIEDNKDILIVSVLLTEYSSAEYYFLDHRQDANGVSTVFSGAPITLQNPTSIDVRIETIRINPISEEVIRKNEYEYEITINPLRTIEERNYMPEARREDYPLLSLTLIKTPLTIHVIPEWKSKEENEYSLLFYDKYHEAVKQGIPEDTMTLYLDYLPDSLIIGIEEKDSNYECVFVSK